MMYCTISVLQYKKEAVKFYAVVCDAVTKTGTVHRSGTLHAVLLWPRKGTVSLRHTASSDVWWCDQEWGTS